MKSELAPALVAQRLAVLGASYVAETVEEGRRRLREAALQPMCSRSRSRVASRSYARSTS